MTAFTDAAIYSSQQVTVPEVIADHIYELAPYETPLLTLTGLDSLPTPCTNVKYQYHDQVHRPTVTTVNGAHAAGSTTLTLTDAIAESGDIVQIGPELILVENTSDNLTFTSCSRSQGAASAAAISDGDQAVVLGKHYAQGSAKGSGSVFIQPSLRTNYTSIIKREPYVSGTANVLPRYGRPGNEYDYQAAYQIRVAYQQLENRVLWGYDTAPSTGSTAGTMNGIYERVQGTNSTAIGSVDITLDNVRTAVRGIAKYGPNPSEPLYMLVPLYTKSVIDSWGQAYVRREQMGDEPVSLSIGTSVDVLHVMGRRVILVPYHKLESEAFLVTQSMLGVGPLQGREFTHTLYGKEGDRIIGEVLGEYTSAVPAAEAHWVFTGLATS
jgi:hypothetical protein